MINETQHFVLTTCHMEAQRNPKTPRETPHYAVAEMTEERVVVIGG
jgi:hypothetical protein